MITELSSHIDQLMRKVYQKQGKVFAEIMINWPKIVSLSLSSSCYPVKIRSYRQKDREIKILHVATNSSSASLALSYQEGVILEKIACYFGYRAIDKIKIQIN